MISFSFFYTAVSELRYELKNEESRGGKPKSQQELEITIVKLMEANKDLDAFNIPYLTTPGTAHDYRGLQTAYEVYSTQLDTAQKKCSLYKANTQKMDIFIKDLLAFSRSGASS